MSKDLNRGLTLLDVFCIATGAMISSGIFILPGLAFSKAGPAVILSYMLAGLLTVPTFLSMSELTTAMPKAGGDYFFIMRGFGPLVGTLAGFSSWFSLSLKGAFALIGMGAYLSLLTHFPIEIIAVACCLLFITLNLTGVKVAGRFQVFLVIGLLAILIAYVLWGAGSINASHFKPFFSGGIGSVFSTAGFVFISYGGLTKVAALAEEIDNPGKNLPLGMILSIVVTTVLFALVASVTVGVVDLGLLKSDLTPISDGAGVFGGRIFKIIVSVGAFLAFISTANAGIMTASRYPLGMSRDKLLPGNFKKINSRFKTPYVAILSTGSFMILAILLLKLDLLVKMASSLLIILFIFANLTVMLFRKSNISSYRPKFHSPLYPYMQLFGILSGSFLLLEMGSFVVFLSGLFLCLGFIWYKVYAEKRSAQDSALMYILEKLVSADKEFASDNLLTELRDIVVQRDEIIKDKFHELVKRSRIIDLAEISEAEKFYRHISDILEKDLDLTKEELFKKFSWREKEAGYIMKKGVAIPHIIVGSGSGTRLLMVRSKKGVVFAQDDVAHIIFVLASSSDERAFHLKILASIAQIAQNPEFDKEWMEADNSEELRNIVLLAERKRG